MNSDFLLLTRELEFIVTELRQLEGCGPHFRIWHRWREPRTECWPGEEIASVSLVHGGREFQLSLSVPSCLLFDYLASHRRVPQCAVQIASGLASEPFYSEHASNVRHGAELKTPICRSLIKTYINRLRGSLRAVFAEAGLDLDPEVVLVSETTDTNEVKYRLRASVEWVHSDNDF